jgi:hypothetical protein
VSNTLNVSPGDLSYCPRCADVYGVLGGVGKRCKCASSAGVAHVFTGGDFPTPFEVCWYCQARVIRSGSRWSTFFCAKCRPTVMSINDSFAGRGLVVLPIGRHSLMNARWSTARPFTTIALVSDWKQRRLRASWRNCSRQADMDWTRFAAFVRASRGASLTSDVLALAASLQESKPDVLTEQLREFNRRLSSDRSPSP